jgi:N4-(beta-N-acetylglucosaminyl)-L-asparaginase
MQTRRTFLSQTALSSIGAAMAGLSNKACAADSYPKIPAMTLVEGKPVVISTWDFGKKANAQAWKVLENKGMALDAVEQGVGLIEADESNSSVGYGGLPDRDGRVTLDACIMDQNGKCGSVCALEHILHPISVARKVMEQTPHIMLVGEGALEFALSQGFKKENLLTPKATQEWEKWKKESKYQPVINIENHDTIGMLAMDASGNLSGACTTSGLAFKMRGRVGDSPIIGAGLYVDNEVGAAVATGLGEAVLRTLSSFLVVELMRQGKSPVDACKEAIERIIKRHPDYKEFQVGLISLSKSGEIGAYSIQAGFTFAVRSDSKDEVFESNSFLS